MTTILLEMYEDNGDYRRIVLGGSRKFLKVLEAEDEEHLRGYWEMIGEKIKGERVKEGFKG